MRYNDGTVIHLDWTCLGRSNGRNDRIVVSADGIARRNRGGNLAAIASLTPKERNTLKQLRSTHASQAEDFHARYGHKDAQAYRLRFSGSGTNPNPQPLKAFAEALIRRLSPDSLIQPQRVVVVAQRSPATTSSRVTLKVNAILSPGQSPGPKPRVGALIHTTLLDARAGAGGEPSVFVLQQPSQSTQAGHWDVQETIFVKVKPARARDMLARRLPPST